MSMEEWQVAFERARNRVTEADERFQAADQVLAQGMAQGDAKPVDQAIHERWLAAKAALDEAHVAWTVIAQRAPLATGTA